MKVERKYKIEVYLKNGDRIVDEEIIIADLGNKLEESDYRREDQNEVLENVFEMRKWEVLAGYHRSIKELNEESIRSSEPVIFLAGSVINVSEICAVHLSPIDSIEWLRYIKDDEGD